MDGCERVRSIFTFLKDMAALKTTHILHIDAQPWKKHVAQIPQDEKYVHMSYRDTVADAAEDEEDDDCILTVRKPLLSACPAPDEILRPWLLPGWDRFEKEAAHYAERPRGARAPKGTEVSLWEEDRESFDEDAARVAAYRLWLKKRAEWAEKQRHLNEIRELFIDLYQLSKELDQESETKELMIGNGILTAADHPGILHPILLKRVRITFDARRNEIAVCDSEAEPELYTTLLSGMDNVNHNAVAPMQQELADNGFHPLDRTEGCDFLKGIVRQLSSEGKFLPHGTELPAQTKDRLFLRDAPVFFVRRRMDGLEKFVDGVIQNIDDTGYVPQTLRAIAGLHEKRTLPEEPPRTPEQRLAELGGEDPDILLAMPANREQLAIAQQIERHDAVIVQGPPGTGKTHTIANLMGHFLAQGKRILVMSHTRKALSVLREKMPEELQSLCVSLLDETNRDMERSVNGISVYATEHNSREQQCKKEEALAARAETIRKLADVRKKIYQITYKEHESLAYGGESLSPAAAARRVKRDEARYASLIPGKVLPGRLLPLSPEELGALYRSNKLLSTEEEQELELDIPTPAALISPETLDELRSCRERAAKRLRALADGLHMEMELTGDALTLTQGQRHITLRRAESASIEELRAYLGTFGELEEWHIHAIVDGARGAGFRRQWELLAEKIEETVLFAGERVDALLGKDVEIAPEADGAELRGVLARMEEIYRQDGKIGFFKRLLDKSYDRAEKHVRINGAVIRSGEDCRIVSDVLTLRTLREECGRCWDALLAPHGVPLFSALGDKEPEHSAATIVPRIRLCLNWQNQAYATLTAHMERAQLRTAELFPKKDLMSAAEQIKQVLTCVHELLPVLCDMLGIYGKHCAAQEELRAAEKELESLSASRSVRVSDLIRAFYGQGAKSYAEAYRRIALLHEKYALRAIREDCLQRLHIVAPDWASAIRARSGIHGASEAPAEIDEAWRWKQYDAMLKELMKYSLEEYQEKNTDLGKEYREKTQDAAVCSAWEHMLRRSERDGSIQQNLENWRQTVQSLGTGKGKNAANLRAQARDLLGKCQQVVPAWIMTIRTALLQLDPKIHRFDVIIIDEASQADLSALAMLYLGQKIIIVGDDKQVSPLAVGQAQTPINKLIKMHLAGRVPAPYCYTGKISLYDIGRTVCQQLMLREHFRCVPDIIGFSNQLCYDGRIKPLRDASDSPLLPALVTHRVDGARSGKGKTNRAEAEQTVALIAAMTQLPAYRDKTFGVISLLGNEQAKLVMDLLMRSRVNIEHHSILCGDAAQFQGDERDVILLNMVDSVDGDGMLRLTREEKIVQRYNVAVSRARDQLWILHSFPLQALKGEDIRARLLRYAADPHAAYDALPQIQKMSDSPFEEEVAKALVTCGYDIVQQWEVGRYRIDIVVREGAKKIALECDGERYHSSEEQVYADMERQMILERLGWRFIRLRGSAYYRDPAGAMQWVMRRLSAHSIHPAAAQPAPIFTALLNEVRRGAERYLQKERNEDAGSPISCMLCIGLFP